METTREATCRNARLAKLLLVLKFATVMKASLNGAFKLILEYGSIRQMTTAPQAPSDSQHVSARGAEAASLLLNFVIKHAKIKGHSFSKWFKRRVGTTFF